MLFYCLVKISILSKKKWLMLMNLWIFAAGWCFTRNHMVTCILKWSSENHLPGRWGDKCAMIMVFQCKPKSKYKWGNSTPRGKTIKNPVAKHLWVQAVMFGIFWVIYIEHFDSFPHVMCVLILNSTGPNICPSVWYVNIYCICVCVGGGACTQ